MTRGIWVLLVIACLTESHLTQAKNLNAASFFRLRRGSGKEDTAPRRPGKEETAPRRPRSSEVTVSAEEKAAARHRPTAEDAGIASHRHRGSADEGAGHRHTPTDVVLTADDKGDFPMVFYGPRSKKLDIVMAHYDPGRTAETLEFWLDFLKMEKMAKMQPFVWLYCQNERMNLTGLTPLVRGGGEMVHLDNIGREGHAYLQHIIRQWDDLAEYTLFTQDIPDRKMPLRFEKQFRSDTGFLPLSFTGKVDCFHDTSTRMIAQLHGIFTRSLCPVHGYYGAFEGQHLVSRRRIRGQDLGIWKHLLELIAAPEEHWLHEYHDANDFKKPDNPLFGHALERGWTLIFNCYEVWRIQNCMRCDNDGFEGCTKDDCQCYDLPE